MRMNLIPRMLSLPEYCAKHVYRSSLSACLAGTRSGKPQNVDVVRLPLPPPPSIPPPNNARRRRDTHTEERRNRSRSGKYVIPKTATRRRTKWTVKRRSGARTNGGRQPRIAEHRRLPYRNLLSSIPSIFSIYTQPEPLEHLIGTRVYSYQRSISIFQTSKPPKLRIVIIYEF